MSNASDRSQSRPVGGAASAIRSGVIDHCKGAVPGGRFSPLDSGDMRFGYRLLLLFAFTAAVSLTLRWVDPVEERHIDSSAVQGRWTAQEIDGLPIVAGENSAEIPWVRLNSGQMSGSFGCARFEAEYSVSAANLLVSDVVEEARSCAGDSADDESVFAERLLRDVVASEDVAVHVEERLMVWVAKGHEVIFVR